MGKRYAYFSKVVSLNNLAKIILTLFITQCKKDQIGGQNQKEEYKVF
jgi:hypothetical protein